MSWIYDKEKEESVFRGRFLTISVHNISGKTSKEKYPNDWFLTCRGLDLDCIKLEAIALLPAQLEALDLCARMVNRYNGDVQKAQVILNAEPLGA